MPPNTGSFQFGCLWTFPPSLEHFWSFEGLWCTGETNCCIWGWFSGQLLAGFWANKSHKIYHFQEKLGLGAVSAFTCQSCCLKIHMQSMGCIWCTLAFMLNLGWVVTETMNSLWKNAYKQKLFPEAHFTICWLCTEISHKRETITFSAKVNHFEVMIFMHYVMVSFSLIY